MIIAQKSRKGFSLIEMLIVMAIIGVLLSAAIPSWTKYRLNSDLRTAARGVASDFFNTKQRAIGETVEYRIIFNVNGNSYQIRNMSSGEFKTKNLSEFAEGIEMTSAAFSFGNPIIIFSARGIAENGSVILHNSKGSTATITVNITGRTHVTFSMH